MINQGNKEFNEKLNEIMSIGLKRAGKVIGEFTDSNVILDTKKIHLTEDVSSLDLFSDHIIVQEMEGQELKGKSIFSMVDDELVKLLEYLEVIDGDIKDDDAEQLEMILDTYQEIGNIILGNIISVIVDSLGERVKIKLPYIVDKKELSKSKGIKHIVVDVDFKIEKLNAEGSLCLILEETTIEKMLTKYSETDR
jgi:chemotaxis protein CheY-P-specific phosphatase CheC